MGKTQLEKSHSKISNFKLTMLCVLTALFFNLIFIGAVILKEYNIIFGSAISGGSFVATIFCYLAIGRFTR